MSVISYLLLISPLKVHHCLHRVLNSPSFGSNQRLYPLCLVLVISSDIPKRNIDRLLKYRQIVKINNLSEYFSLVYVHQLLWNCFKMIMEFVDIIHHKNSASSLRASKFVIKRYRKLKTNDNFYAFLTPIKENNFHFDL